VPTNYTDQFYTFDPANPPPAGTSVSFTSFVLRDGNDDGDIEANTTDRVNGQRIDAAYPGDTVTINVNGTNVTYTGITFYLRNGQRVFTPTDGQVLKNGTFVSATFVTGQGPLAVPDSSGRCASRPAR
jgi:archaellum component FlaF (FlaF/FlaG flagellin family)